MNWPKVAGYVGVTSSAVSIVSQLAATIIPEQDFHERLSDILRWSSYFWSYAIIAMSAYLCKISLKPIHIVIGVILALTCLFIRAEVVYGIGIVYFFWAYAKLDQNPENLPY